MSVGQSGWPPKEVETLFVFHGRRARACATFDDDARVVAKPFEREIRSLTLASRRERERERERETLDFVDRVVSPQNSRSFRLYRLAKDGAQSSPQRPVSTTQQCAAVATAGRALLLGGPHDEREELLAGPQAAGLEHGRERDLRHTDVCLHSCGIELGHLSTVRRSARVGGD